MTSDGPSPGSNCRGLTYRGGMDIAKSLKNVLALANHGLRTMPGLSEEAMLELAHDVVQVKQHLASLPVPPPPEKA